MQNNTWLILLPVFILFLIGSLISYYDNIRNSKWFIIIYISISIIGSLFWIVACKAFNNKNKIYVFSIFWDFLMIISYYVIPCIIFNLNFKKEFWFGLVLMLTGLLLIKFNHN